MDLHSLNPKLTRDILGLAGTQHSWYLLYTKARSECLAQENLERQAYTTYLPQVKIDRRKKGQIIQCIEAFFPRYLFIHLNTESDNWSPIRSTIGVAGLVRFGNAFPSVVPDALIQSLQNSENEHSLQSLNKISLVPGEKINVAEGPFAGQVATFHSMQSAGRVRVLLDIIGKSTVTTLKFKDLAIEAYA